MIGETNAFKEAAMLARLAYLDSGAGAASVAFYDTTRPATGGSAGGAPLATVDLVEPAGTVSAAGVLTLIVPRDGLITQSGTPTWARFFNGAGAVAFDCDVGTEIILSQPLLYAGGTIRIVSAVFG